MPSSRDVFRQLEYNTRPGPYFKSEGELPSATPAASAVRLIAYYLPQFHQTAENDKWWGAGFTEWTNVTKAYPRYVGHRQPRLPSDLGFYDLSNPDILRAQAALARRAGLYGFCIHDYWFSGEKTLSTPLRILVDNPDIDLRYCLNWANENWTRRWDGHNDDVLLRQSHRPEDPAEYMRSILPSLRDPRYIRINGRPLVMIYRPSVIPASASFVRACRAFLISENIGDPYFVMPQVHDQEDPRPHGMDAAAGFPPHNNGFRTANRRSSLKLLDSNFDGFGFEYEAMVAKALSQEKAAYRQFPGVCPGWDNEARRPGRGVGFFGSTPERYARWLADACAIAAVAEEPDERIVFINAWNEWAEGAILEPDRHYGHAYLLATRQVAEASGALPKEPAAIAREFEAPRLSRRNRAVAVMRKLVRGRYLKPKT